MGRLRNRTTGQTYDVPDVDAVQAARNDPNLEVIGDVPISPGSTFPGEAVVGDPNAPVTSPEELGATEHAALGVRTHDTLASRTRSFIGGGASGLSLGFVNPWNDDQEFHPNYATAGNVAGIAATLLVPGAGEVNVAKEGLAAGEAAAESLGLLGRARGALTSAGETIGRAAEFTPLGQVTRLSEAAGGLVGGTGAAARVGRTALAGAVGGGAIGAGTELSHQLLESDAPFSAEALLEATGKGAAVGGLIGGAVTTYLEGVNAVGGILRRTAGRLEELAPSPALRARLTARASSRVPQLYSELAETTEERPPLAPLLDVRGSSLLDGVSSRSRDLEALGARIKELSEAPVLAKSAGFTQQFLSETQATVQRELTGLRSLARFDDAPLARLAEDAHANDLAGIRLAEVTGRLPARFTDVNRVTADLTARDAALDEIASRRAKGLPVSQAEEDAARYSVTLTSGLDPAVRPAVAGGLVANAARTLIRRLPGGRIIASGLGAGGAVLALEHAVTHGVAGVLGHAVLPGLGIIVGTRAVQAAFRDPRVGGILAANVPTILNRTGVLRGSTPGTSSDPRRALRELGDRVRTVSPGQASAGTVGSLAHVGGSSPLTLSHVATTAEGRHAQLLQILDRLDPKPSSPGQALLGRPLPSAGAAREAADAIRILSSPSAFLVLAQAGRLTSADLALAERTWPATVRRARAELLAEITAHPTAVNVSNRHTVEILLGHAAMGDAGRTASYGMAMQLAVNRGSPAAIATGQPHPRPLPVAPPAPTPAARAANPGAYR